MNKDLITEIAHNFVLNSEFNYLSKDLALEPQLSGMKLFDDPLFAFGLAQDVLFETLKDPKAVGSHFMLPGEWLPEAETVISYFFPFTAEIKKSNRQNRTWPSNQWLHGRIEGQQFINEFTKHLNSRLIDSGFKSLVPAADPRYWSLTGETDGYAYTSNWSERHVGFICGLGTFGLSKGIITANGMAGRIGSLVTSLKLEPDTRYYSEFYENCSMCGACVRQCPVQAITLESGKQHRPCSLFIDQTQKKHNPRYGCGKCQVGVPCESRIPMKSSS